MAAATFIGFAPSYYLTALNDSPTPLLTPAVHVHGAFCTAWIVLLILQTQLIASGRRHLHKVLGIGGIVIAATVLVTGIGVALASNRRVHTAATADTMADPYVFLIFPMTAVCLFAVFVLLGTFQRHRPDYHKRFMLLATASLIAPAFARIVTQVFAVPGALGALALIDVFVVALAFHDFRARGKLHPATLWGGGFLVLSGPARVALGFTAIWQAFAQSLLS